MTWDIYGNPLQRGHCEVHPHVHEDYPCSVCMSERGQTQQPHDALQQLQYEFAQQGDYIKQLQTERDALAARIQTAERVEKIFSEMPELTFDDCLKLFADEIRDIQAEAGFNGFLAGFDCSYEGFNSEYGASEARIYEFAEEYAATVRQGGE